MAHVMLSGCLPWQRVAMFRAVMSWLCLEKMVEGSKPTKSPRTPQCLDPPLTHTHISGMHACTHCAHTHTHRIKVWSGLCGWLRAPVRFWEGDISPQKRPISLRGPGPCLELEQPRGPFWAKCGKKILCWSSALRAFTLRTQ